MYLEKLNFPRDGDESDDEDEDIIVYTQDERDLTTYKFLEYIRQVNISYRLLPIVKVALTSMLTYIKMKIPDATEKEIEIVMEEAINETKVSLAKFWKPLVLVEDIL